MNAKVIKWCLASSVGILAMCGATVAQATDPGMDPDAIRGVKVKNRPDASWTGGVDNIWRSTKFETGSLEGTPQYDEFCQAMQDHDPVNAIALRFPDRKEEFVGGNDDTIAEVQEEAAKLIVACYARGMPIFFFERRTLVDGPTAKTNEFISDLKGVVDEINNINPAAVNGIAGVALTESGFVDGSAIRSGAINFAHAINNASGLTNFLKTRTLIFPGGYFGADFRNIRKDSSGTSGNAVNAPFYAGLSAETKYFAWSFKFMDNDADNGNYAGIGGPIYPGLTEANKELFLGYSDYTYINNGNSGPHLNDGSGLNSLAQMVDWGNNNNYQNYAHVIFWGDNADTVANMSDDDRTAVRHVFYNKEWKGYFFNLAIAIKGDDRYYLQGKVNFINEGYLDTNGEKKYSPLAMTTIVQNNSASPVSGHPNNPTNLYNTWLNWRSPTP